MGLKDAASNLRVLLSRRAEEEGPTEANLRYLMNLRIVKTSQDTSSSSGVRENMSRCLDVTTRATSYCSRLVFRVKTQGWLGSRDAERMEWRVDIAKPDRYHVSRTAWQKGSSKPLFDEWITLGDEHYICAALWFRADSEKNDEMNRFLLADKWLGALMAVEPALVRTCQYRDRRYLLLECNSEKARTFVPFINLLMEGSTLTPSNLRAYLFLDLENYFLAKGELAIEGQSSKDGYIRFELRQAFTSYGEAIVIDRPHIGLEPCPGEPGRSVVTDNRVFPSPFHR